VRPCARPFVRAFVLVCVLIERYLTTQWKEFHLTLVGGVAEAKDELISFKVKGSRIRSLQGQT